MYIKHMERFWNKVNKDGPVLSKELGSCWIWTAGKSGKMGYGNFHITHRHRVMAHRYSFFLEHGREATPLCLHKCDNPPCVNPCHLFEGSTRDNVQDCVVKGRKPRKESNGGSKLVQEQVDQIRSLYGTGRFTQLSLGEKFGMSQTQIGNIVRNAKNGGWA